MVHGYVRGLTCRPNIYVSWSTSELRVRLAPWNRFKPSSKILWFCYFPIRNPGTGVVLDCIESWSLLSFLLYSKASYMQNVTIFAHQIGISVVLTTWHNSHIYPYQHVGKIKNRTAARWSHPALLRHYIIKMTSPYRIYSVFSGSIFHVFSI